MKLSLSCVLLCVIGPCFASSGVAGEAVEPSYASQASDILEATGVQGGLVVHLGCKTGRLTAALRTDESFVVHGLARHAEHVQHARNFIHAQSLYGPVSVEVQTGPRLPYTDNLVNLIVAEDSLDIPQDELMRVLCPKGVLYQRSGDSWVTTIKPRPANIDEWTHYMHGPDNNAVAKDSVVGPPYHLQWIGGPKWARGHEQLASISVVITSNGRVFYVADESPAASVALPSKWVLAARDAFNGKLLWKLDIDKWEDQLRPFRSGPTHLPRRLVGLDDEVFMTLGFGKAVTALDAATGGAVRTYAGTEGTEEILAEDNRLYLVIGDPENQKAADIAVRRGQPQPTVNKHIRVLDRYSGETLWEKADPDTADLYSQTLAVSNGHVYFQNTRAVVCLDASNGQQVWRTLRPSSLKRPGWSVPSLVVQGPVVYSADREAPSLVEDSGPQDVSWEISFAGGNAPLGDLIAYDALHGRELWRTDCQEGYNSPVDVLLTDGLLWTGNLVKASDPGITQGRDPLTGDVQRKRPSDLDFFKPGMSHHRCYRNRATENFILLGRSGVEMVDVKTGDAVANHWIRGTCQFGVLPANGMIYAPPHSCACYVKTKLNGFNALAPRRADDPDDPPMVDQLERGPAYGALDGALEDETADDWPMYRRDAQRSGATLTRVPARLHTAWTTDIGGRLSSPIVAGSRVFVSQLDTHTVHALDRDSGLSLWRYTVGGRVDSPPTVYQGKVFFGSADGHVYCLRASDGQLVWRFRGGPEDRRILADEQLESTWPVHGSVLIHAGLVYFTAGRSSFIDGGMWMTGLEPHTGESVYSQRINDRDPATGQQPKDAINGFDMESGLPDVLSSDGQYLFMRDLRFDAQCSKQADKSVHLFSPTGFLDDSWWHRSYWLWGAEFKSGWGGWHQTGNTVPAGRILVFNNDSIFGYGRNEYPQGNAGQWNTGEHYRMFAADKQLKTPEPEPVVDPAEVRRGRKAYPKSLVNFRWQQTIEPEVRALVLAGNLLFAAGPHGETHKSLAAYEGTEGISLRVMATSDGSELATYPLESLPVFDGLVAAHGCLFLSTREGAVVSFAAAQP